METALLESSVQDRVGALRERIGVSRENAMRAREMFAGNTASTLPPGIDEVLSGIRGEQFPRLRSDDAAEHASPNPGLPMMAGTTNKQK